MVISSVYDFIYEALEFKKANENKARENLSALIRWSENEGKKELEFAKNLSKETYKQERVTQEIIKNFEKIKTSIESMRTLTIYSITDEDNKLAIKAYPCYFRSNTDIILYLLDREKTFIGQKTYLLFDEKRFKAFEDFLFFINTHLEKDAL
ncbi:hypothetical protein [Campylobacter helveticus]|nr:hypothetical protein [Campylobacter helveticus]MCR2063069.1 hypothetical protein [Campylobacter helveticus]